MTDDKIIKNIPKFEEKIRDLFQVDVKQTSGTSNWLKDKDDKICAKIIDTTIFDSYLTGISPELFSFFGYSSQSKEDTLDVTIIFKNEQHILTISRNPSQQLPRLNFKPKSILEIFLEGNLDKKQIGTTAFVFERIDYGTYNLTLVVLNTLESEEQITVEQSNNLSGWERVSPNIIKRKCDNFFNQLDLPYIDLTIPSELFDFFGYDRSGVPTNVNIRYDSDQEQHSIVNGENLPESSETCAHIIFEKASILHKLLLDTDETDRKSKELIIVHYVNCKDDNSNKDDQTKKTKKINLTGYWINIFDLSRKIDRLAYDFLLLRDYCQHPGYQVFGIKYSSFLEDGDLKLICQKLHGCGGTYSSLSAEIYKGTAVSKFVMLKENLGLQNYASPKNQHHYGENKIIYGTPGCGKSHYVKTELLHGYSDENIFRTTFHQDYTNTDFIGQILPVINGEKVTYNFVPGPFTLALKQALLKEKTGEKIALVIEELNRGNAASIFGDIFQLLDRENGESKYTIINVGIEGYLKETIPDIFIPEKHIRIPANLDIIATMNTSDQNVYTLDTAFKRRWDFEKLSNKFNDKDKEIQDLYVPGLDNIMWKDFVMQINEFIISSETDIINSEDKQLGKYFVDKSYLLKEKIKEDEMEMMSGKFASKVIEYLWDDVFKYNHRLLFNEKYHCLDEILSDYKSEGRKGDGMIIFSDAFRESLQNNEK